MIEENINKVDELVELIKEYSSKNPEQRFTQILFNLKINEFKDDDFTQGLRDNYNDLDQNVLKRIRERLRLLNK
ncbi:MULTISPECIES: hypothetical protein [Empedobacter]|uniref:Uncharacterized protein n=1 Tax=Empedobacter falsenii TaxID=343874 RepID=A0A376G2N5_9FLAO|nr:MULTISPECIES: hypothetical protein [Empedobacter]HBX62055.1 hypothetical protein [Flavobacteriaceae bacterium]MBW1618530.1 hypothetical protein [Empedobacter falsenii]MDH0675634.1 hypothetical protein [Empedobacter sp. GD03861]MDH1601749.1 hypothetical protein [Empedobacter sp. GD03739]STD54899.1 Uncharacterised protein [Empedobacter falsenii]